jgi:ABC-type glutathione transport system ATPase component
VALSALLPDQLRQCYQGLEQLVVVEQAWPALNLKAVAEKVDAQHEATGMGVRNDFPLTRRCRSIFNQPAGPAARANIDPKKTLWAVVSDELDYINVGQVEMPSRAYVSAFGFKGPDQQKPAGVLSGGERNRLNLALTLKEGGNLLLLDEPTNDLDVETLSSLENALLEFPGAAVVISHDRWFLDRVATHILAYEGDSKWYWFEGNFESYEKNKVERLGADAARPHRATYKKLTRG